MEQYAELTLTNTYDKLMKNGASDLEKSMYDIDIPVPSYKDISIAVFHWLLQNTVMGMQKPNCKSCSSGLPVHPFLKDMDYIEHTCCRKPAKAMMASLMDKIEKKPENFQQFLGRVIDILPIEITIPDEINIPDISKIIKEWFDLDDPTDNQPLCTSLVEIGFLCTNLNDIEALQIKKQPAPSNAFKYKKI